MQWLKNLYRWAILKHPSITLILILALAAWIGSYAPKFQFDASAETLLLKEDKDLDYYRKVRSKYGLDDYLILAYSPKQGVFSQPVLSTLQKLKRQLNQVENVEKITSILDVPLIKSPPVTYQELAQQIRTIEKGNVNLSLARQEIRISPFYRGLLLSKDAKSTALLIDLTTDKELTKTPPKKLSRAEKNKLDERRAKFNFKQRQSIDKIRNIMNKHADTGTLHLGGVPMIAVDSIRFIEHDFYVFGMIVIICISILLFLIFREIRWVILPLMTCLLSGLFVVGLLGLLGWPVTVVSSNFPPLLLILTLSLLIYLIVSYREIELQSKNEVVDDLILLTIKSKFTPSFYTSLTSILGFGSLVVSGIQPLIDFGLIMAIGLTIRFKYSNAKMQLITIFREIG